MREGFAARVDAAFDSVREALQKVGHPVPGEADAAAGIAPRHEPGMKRAARAGVILGSGLGDFVEKVDGLEIPYQQIRGFPVPTVAGHRGMLKLGPRAAVLAGRFHAYEGWNMDDVVLPVFLAARLGIDTLICTNAAGAVNVSFEPGDLVLIRDHLNLMSRNPLIGPPLENLGPRFPDMSEAYSDELRRLAQECSDRRLAEGVYAALSGPTYETPAEIRMLRVLGADLVGMSTVPEVIAAKFLGMRVLGISCVTNMAAGVTDRPLNHEEVIATGRKTSARFAELLCAVLDALSRDIDESSG